MILLKWIELEAKCLSMFEEIVWSKVLGKHIRHVLIGRHVVELDVAEFNLLSDVMVAYFNMLDPLLGDGILRVENSTMTISIERNIWDRLSKFLK